MWDEMKFKKPKNILDLGSGFSSFVFRYYKKLNEKCNVTSVDTSVEWLEKTISFLEKNKLDTQNIYTFKQFKKLKNIKHNYDFILYDLGPTSTRAENLEYVLELAKPNCPIVIDDLHNNNYKKDVIDIVSNSRKNLFFLNEETFDVYGRYAALVK
jgi:predicted O-methyltransferase YrrM